MRSVGCIALRGIVTGSALFRLVDIWSLVVLVVVQIIVSVSMWFEGAVVIMAEATVIRHGTYYYSFS
jgi:hypothetical protein